MCFELIRCIVMCCMYCDAIISTYVDTVVVNSVPAGYYEDDGDDFDDLVSFTFTGPDYHSTVNDGFTLSSIFQVL